MSRKTEKQNHISLIKPKCLGMSTENFTIFFFKMQEKLEMCRNSNLTNLRKPYSGDDINVIFTS